MPQQFIAFVVFRWDKYSFGGTSKHDYMSYRTSALYELVYSSVNRVVLFIIKMNLTLFSTNALFKSRLLVACVWCSETLQHVLHLMPL